MSLRSCALATCCLLAAAGAHAEATLRSGTYVQYARTRTDTNVATVGITAPIQWTSSLWGTRVGAYWDVYYSRLPSANKALDADATHLIGLKPVFRFRLSQGLSPWFGEAGLGVTYTDHRYQSDHQKFGSRFDFATHVGVGYSFGARYQHELILRGEHISNAGIKKPNPGENFVQLRYHYSF